MIILREPNPADKESFLLVMRESALFHFPWIKAPLTEEDFNAYLCRYQQENQKSYLVIEQATGAIAGVFNLNEIVRGVFQNAFLGFYAVKAYSGKGYMSAGLKLVLEKAFTELKLHRLEANIQPNNILSLLLVQRNGFRKEGYSQRYLQINGEWKDHERWAITYKVIMRCRMQHL